MPKESFKNNSKDRERARRIVERLEKEFKKTLPDEGPGFLTLVRTILSQNTHRKNTEKAFENLTSKFRTADEISNVETDEIVNLIRPAGMYTQKARSIKNVAEEFSGTSGKDLDEMLDKRPEEAREELLSLPGVGPKTADCVLLFSGGRDILPVDTHVARISKRLGLAEPGAGPEKVKKQMEPVMPDGKRGIAHILLIELGRRYCKAKSPDCKNCPIENLCPKIGLKEG